MSKHSETSLGKLNQEELRAIATELKVKFQDNDTKEMLVTAILGVQLKAENTSLKEEVKELKAKPDLTQELADSEKVISEQHEEIKSLGAQLSNLPTVQKSAKNETPKDFVKIGNKELSLNPKLKEVVLDGKTYAREEALKSEAIMGKLVKNNYPHLVKK